MSNYKIKEKEYKVKRSDVIQCEILSVVTDRHHGTQIMIKTEYDGTFFVDLNKEFFLFTHKKPAEHANNPFDWSNINKREIE